MHDEKLIEYLICYVMEVHVCPPSSKTDAHTTMPVDRVPSVNQPAVITAVKGYFLSSSILRLEQQVLEEGSPTQLHVDYLLDVEGLHHNNGLAGLLPILFS